jgi:hypothetical protein
MVVRPRRKTGHRPVDKAAAPRNNPDRQGLRTPYTRRPGRLLTAQPGLTRGASVLDSLAFTGSI